MSAARHFSLVVAAPAPALAVLAEHTGLPKARLKHAMNCGAVWLKRTGQVERRLRRATTDLQAGDRLDCYYDADILARLPPLATLVADERRYSVWDKPAGLLSQGSRYGDHCSLLRQVEQRLQRPVFLLHRLDREACGLVLLAHDREAAARLSAMFQARAIDKHYRAAVQGLTSEQGAIRQSLDGREAETHYRRRSHDAGQDRSWLEVTLITGRKHQIRRHLAAIGHPLLGDGRYGGPPCVDGLQLVAERLALRCPFSGQPRDYRRVS